VTADSAFAALRSGPLAARFREVAERLRAAAAPVVRSDTGFVLADPDFIPEGIAYDPAGDAFYVGSLHGGGVARVSRGGAAATFLAGSRHDLDQVLGLRVDAPRGRLWLAALVRDSAAPRFQDGVGGWAALHAYDLRTGRLLGRYPAPDSSRPHLLNDIAVAPNGDVYVTDSEGEALLRLRSGARALERVYGGAADFTYPNGVAVGPDGRWLYVAHAEGLSAVALGGAEAGRVVRVATPQGVSAGGIDGLYACGDGLLAVQSLVDFQQVTRFHLAADGRRVASAEALERRHPAHDAATTGAVAGDAFLYIANAQLGRLRPDGELSPAAGPARSVVLRLPLGGRCGARAARGA
jgi:sugar lactone lactonase YvrE